MKVVFCYPCFENLGLEYLSAVLKQHGIRTDLVFDPLLFGDPFLTVPRLAPLFDRGEGLPAEVMRLQPDLVAFSVLASSYRWALDLAGRIKALADVPVVFGGIHAMAVPEAVLQHRQVDYCILGEGEGALCDLALALRDGRDLSQIPNLCFCEDGGVVKNPQRPPIEDLDALPLADKGLFYRVFPELSKDYTIITRRGCINRCSYCHNTIWQRLYPGQARVRLRSVENVIEELALARSRYAFRRLRINDDLFSYNPDWLVRFCRLYRREIGRPFMCSCSPVDLTPAVVQELRAAGCFQVCVGVQDVREPYRRAVLGRHTPQAAITSALATLRRHRLRATVDNIIGFEGFTEEDFRRIAEFYLDNPVLGRFTIFWLIFFPGTEITELALARGLLTREAYERLPQSPEQRANTLLDERTTSRLARSMQLFLVLMQMLPRPLPRLLFRLHAYRYLPPLDPSVLEGLWTIFTRDRLDPVRRRYYHRLWRFGLLGPARRALGVALDNLRRSSSSPGVTWSGPGPAPQSSGQRPILSVVIPTTGENALLGRTVRELALGLAIPHEILIVLNGSDPRTRELARALSAEMAQVSVASFLRRVGKGRAILTGLDHAAGDILGFVDADGPFGPASLAALVQEIAQRKTDCAIASKWLGQRYREVTTYTLRSKKLLSRVLNLITRRGFSLPFADTQGGAKFFSRRAWQGIDHGFVCLGFDFDIELLWKIQRAGFSISERRLPCRRTRASTFSLTHSVAMLLNLARLRLGPRAE